MEDLDDNIIESELVLRTRKRTEIHGEETKIQIKGIDDLQCRECENLVELNSCYICTKCQDYKICQDCFNMNVGIYFVVNTR